MQHDKGMNGDGISMKEEGAGNGGAHAVEPDGQQPDSAVPADGEVVSER